MNEYRVELSLSNVERHLSELTKEVETLNERVIPSDGLLDNFDMIKSLNISQRTLATWRSKGLIGYVKVGKKIYYSKKDRDDFIEKFHIINDNDGSRKEK